MISCPLPKHIRYFSFFIDIIMGEVKLIITSQKKTLSGHNMLFASTQHLFSNILETNRTYWSICFSIENNESLSTTKTNVRSVVFLKL